MEGAQCDAESHAFDVDRAGAQWRIRDRGRKTYLCTEHYRIPPQRDASRHSSRSQCAFMVCCYVFHHFSYFAHAPRPAAKWIGLGRAMEVTGQEREKDPEARSWTGKCVDPLLSQVPVLRAEVWEGDGVLVGWGGFWRNNGTSTCK